MVKVKPANLDPGAIARLKGRFLIRPSEGGWVAQKWPRKRGTTQSWRSQWTSKQWSYAARWAANPEPISYITAIEMTKGTDWVPRDLLMRGIFGTAYQIFGPNGEIYRPNPHRAPDAPPSPGPTPDPEGRTPMRCWQWSLQYNTAHTQMSSSAYNLKGGLFTSRVDATVRAVAVIFQPQATQTYQVHLCHVDGSNIVQTVVSSATQSPSTADLQVYLFPITATLEAGNRYAVLIGRTTGSTTNPLPINFTQNAQWLWPVSNPTSARLAALTPSIGNLVDDNGASTLVPPFGLDIEF